MDYKYQSLGHLHEIRILELKPAGFMDDDLHARIVHRRYPIETEDASGVNYWNAASYTWGSDPPSRVLYIDSTFPQEPNNGQSVLRITPNVDSMLRNLRDKEHEHYVWIDAICLNQQDSAEKCQQIPCMQWIYRLANQVLVWLGEDDGTARVAIKLVETMAIMSQRAGFEMEGDARHLGFALITLLGTERPHALDKLFHRPWFGRRWILQEVALAREVIVICGRNALPWTKFRAGMEVISTAQSGGVLFHSRVIDDQSARAMRNLLKVNRVSGLLLDMLWNFDTAACKEKHDVVYALLFMGGGPAPNDRDVSSSIEFSISSDADLERLAEAAAQLSVEGGEDAVGLPVSADYSIPWQRLFTDIAGYFVRHAGFGAITRHVFAFGALHDMHADWPSWVPDWSKARRPEPSKGMSNVVPWSRSVRVTDKTLQLSARLMNTIIRVFNDLTPSAPDFRKVVKNLLRDTDMTPVATDPADLEENTRDLTVSELVIGQLIRRGLDTGLCAPIPAESEQITEPWIVNNLAACAISRAIFTPEWRTAGETGILDGIIAGLRGSSLFLTGAGALGIGPANVQIDDQIMLVEDYHGLPDLNRQDAGEMKLRALAVLRPVDQQKSPQPSIGEGRSYTLVGPCVVARAKEEADAKRVRIMLA